MTETVTEQDGTTKRHRIGGVAYREKRGATYWVQCPACDSWHHVSPDLLRSQTIPMHCPACHTEFGAQEAGAVRVP